MGGVHIGSERQEEPGNTKALRIWLNEGRLLNTVTTRGTLDSSVISYFLVVFIN